MTKKQPHKQNRQTDLFHPHGSQPVHEKANTACTDVCPPNDWTQPERVFIDLELPQLTIGRALATFDDARLWSEYRRAKDPEMYLDWLGNLAGSDSWECPHPRDRSRQTTSHLMLFAVPYLLPPSGNQVPAVLAADRDGAWSMLHCIRGWVGHQQHATMLLSPVPYEEICRWSPVTQRERLQLLGGRKATSAAPWLTTEARIPREFPMLSFVVGGVQRWFAHPELPAPGLAGSRDWQMLSQLAAHLAYLHRRGVQTNDVRLPSPFSPAVLEGIRMWVAELGRLQLARSWQVHVRRDDLVLLEIECRDEEAPAVMLPLRLHQIGPTGLELLMLDLQREIGPAIVTEPASA